MALIGAYTDKGRVKKVDQDACCFLEATTPAGPAYLAVMCDGVGGLALGELASATVVRRFATWFAQGFPETAQRASYGIDALMGSVRSTWGALLQGLNDDIRRYGNGNDTVLGTTFTGMLAIGGRYLIGHVGDCRAYEVSPQRCRQLTQDQTLVAQQVAEGLLTPEQAANHPKRNVILQSVGTQDELEPAFVEGAFDPDAMYVLCCDGLYNKLAAGEMQSAFMPGQFADGGSLQNRCAEVVQTMIARGEKDNVSILAFRGGEPPASSRGATGAASGNLPADADSATAHVDGGESPTIVVDGGESPTVVVDAGESPTVVVGGRGGGAR